MSWFGDDEQSKIWAVASTIICLVFAVLPIIMITLHSWPLAAFLAFFFWPGLFLVARDSIRQKCLPVIVGGPRINLAMGVKRRG